MRRAAAAASNRTWRSSRWRRPPRKRSARRFRRPFLYPSEAREPYDCPSIRVAIGLPRCARDVSKDYVSRRLRLFLLAGLRRVFLRRFLDFFLESLQQRHLAAVEGA